MKIEVHKQGGTRLVVEMEPGATNGATIGRNVWNADGTLFDPAPSTPGQPGQPPITYWPLILEIPPNVTALAETGTTGIYVVTGPGSSVTRQITVGPGLAITNPSGVAGNPHITRTDEAVTLTADGPISALRVVVANDGQASYPDLDVVSDATRAAGVTLTSGASGDPVQIRTQGEIIEASWAWSPGIVWCGDDGVLTQTQPSSGWLLEVGRALSATRLMVDLKTPYVRI